MANFQIYSCLFRHSLTENGCSFNTDASKEVIISGVVCPLCVKIGRELGYCMALDFRSPVSTMLGRRSNISWESLIICWSQNEPSQCQGASKKRLYTFFGAIRSTASPAHALQSKVFLE